MQTKEREIEAARRRREKILNNSGSRMETVGGDFNDANGKPDFFEPKDDFGQREFDRWLALVYVCWICFLVLLSGCYGFYYFRHLWMPDMPKPYRTLLRIHPLPAFFLAEAVKHAVIVSRAPKAAQSEMWIGHVAQMLPIPRVCIRIISNAPYLWKQYKLLGDVVGDLCLALVVMQVTMVGLKFIHGV